jgi:hypothetical protein
MSSILISKAYIAICMERRGSPLGSAFDNPAVIITRSN